MYIQEKKDLDQQWLSTHYRVIEKEINQIVNDWDEEWRIPVTETMQQDTQLEKETQEPKKDQEEEEETRRTRKW
jgi:hypothetical protein